ncbi:mobile element protein [Agrobacterium phage OLIVR4]|nr:mobile element protein [Agrobacterium phage OLIVR4]
MLRITALCLLCMILAGCPRVEPGSTAAVRRIVGTDLIGARGATAEDQRKIDRTIVGLCAPNVYTRDECTRHGTLTSRPL